VHVRRPGLRDLGEGLLGRRIDRAERLAARRRDLAAVDEQPVAFPEANDLATLGRRRVLPRDRPALAEAPRRGRPVAGPGDRLGFGGHRADYRTRPDPTRTNPGSS